MQILNTYFYENRDYVYTRCVHKGSPWYVEFYLAIRHEPKVVFAKPILALFTVIQKPPAS